MAKDRVITGWGPFPLTLSGTTAATEVSDWIRVGPFLANRLTVRAAFDTSTAGNQVKVQGILGSTKPSTGVAAVTGAYTLATRTSTQNGVAINSTVALNMTWVQLRSTGLASGRSVTVHFGAIA